MAREITNKPKRFGLENSDAIEENDRIIEAGRQQRKENRENKENKENEENKENKENGENKENKEEVMEQTKVSDESNATTSNDVPSTQITDQPAIAYGADIVMNARKQKGKKTENGITIYVPMEYYERIVMMKMRTGVPIKDLALQAVIEFLDRNK